jgi:hypothetical protein
MAADMSKARGGIKRFDQQDLSVFRREKVETTKAHSAQDRPATTSKHCIEVRLGSSRTAFQYPRVKTRLRPSERFSFFMNAVEMNEDM